MNLVELKALFRQAGATRLYAKLLSPNDNSKNQVYFGPDFQALNLFPNDGVLPASGSARPIFKAKLRFGWLCPNGAVAVAPGAQLILYPQYPEVRFSGFLQDCATPPSELMRGRMPGRILFLGVTADRRVVGHVVASGSEVAAEFDHHAATADTGVFRQLDLSPGSGESDSRGRLLGELRRIHELGWIDSKQLDSKGGLKPCRAPQCGGFTLEAELGIAKNSVGEPDFLGWEVKQHGVPSVNSLGGAITLMTPEPNGGIYRERGPEEFIRMYGYPDRKGRPDRLNFGGVHRVGTPQATTGLTMVIRGYDAAARKVTDAGGDIALVDRQGRVAASWAFSSLLAHWSRKHLRAVYVPSMCRKEPAWQYAYGPRVRLAQRTDGLRLLAAVAMGQVYYDPGIKLESASQAPEVKRRSQFRIASKSISDLYETVESVEL